MKPNSVIPISLPSTYRSVKKETLKRFKFLCFVSWEEKLLRLWRVQCDKFLISSAGSTIDRERCPYVFMTNSQTDMEEWVRALRKVIGVPASGGSLQISYFNVNFCILSLLMTSLENNTELLNDGKECWETDQRIHLVAHMKRKLVDLKPQTQRLGFCLHSKKKDTKVYFTFLMPQTEIIIN